jgi:hypothetical protein
MYPVACYVQIGIKIPHFLLLLYKLNMIPQWNKTLNFLYPRMKAKKNFFNLRNSNEILLQKQKLRRLWMKLKFWCVVVMILTHQLGI